MNLNLMKKKKIHIQVQNEKKPLKHSIVVDKIKRTIFKENRNYVGMMGGRPGTGKSYSAATILKCVDPTFHVDRVFFSVEELTNFISKNPPKGSAFMLDEAGVAVNYRRWYSGQNEQLMDLIQTWRHSGWVFMMVAPSKKLIDKVNHDFFDQMMNTINIYRDLKLARIEVKEPQTNDTTFKTYNKFPVTRIDMQDFKRAKITSVYVKHPGKNFVIPYEKKKIAFTNALKQRAKFVLSGTTEDLGNNETVKRMTPLQETVYNKIWEGKDRKTISKEMNVSYSSLAGHVLGIRKKGHELPPKGYKPKEGDKAPELNYEDVSHKNTTKKGVIRQAVMAPAPNQNAET